MAYVHVLAVDEQRELLRIARATLREFLVSGHMPPGAPHRKTLLDPAGVFVSLHEEQALRGCIGTVEETRPLYKAVQEMAIAAASRDPRYRAVRLEELNLLRIEISVLGERSPIRSPEEIEVGRHGVTIVHGERRGLLLPKVAVEQEWTPLLLLQKTCVKAGLPPDAWQLDAAQIEIFPAQVFDERTLRAGPFEPR